MRRTLVLDVAGLTPELLGADTPNLRALAERGGARPLATVLPAVTCSAQATFTTGQLPREHGIVANGWYFGDLAEVACNTPAAPIRICFSGTVCVRA